MPPLLWWKRGACKVVNIHPRGIYGCAALVSVCWKFCENFRAQEHDAEVNALIVKSVVPTIRSHR